MALDMELNNRPEAAPERPVPEGRPEQEPAKEQEPTREAPAVVESAEKPSEPAASVAPDVPEPTPAPVAPDKDEYHVKLERLLEDDLVDIYVSMPPQARQKFKEAGEETAVKLRQMLETPKLVFKAVHDLIVKWLRMIPRVNRYFL